MTSPTLLTHERSFATEKQRYHAELFGEARNGLIRQLQDLENAPKLTADPRLKAQVVDFINAMAAARIEDADIAELTASSN